MNSKPNRNETCVWFHVTRAALRLVPTAAALAVLSVVALVTCGQPGPRITTLSGPTMGTTFSVKVVTQEELSEQQTQSLSLQIKNALGDVNQKMSTYISDSELSMLNAFGAGEPYSISRDLLRVLEAAEEVNLSTDGAFDPTVGPVVDLWGFGPTPLGKGSLPSDEQIQEALSRVGWSRLRLNRDASTVLKTEPNLQIDLSAIAKGYAVDRLFELLQDQGFTDFLIEVGGELRVNGFREPLDETPWTVGIEAPSKGAGSPAVHRVLRFTEGALATSGDYRNAYEVDGVRYSHTIDPSTGRPVTHTGASVSVYADTCMMADALATALLVLGPEEGVSWAEQNGIAALFLIYNADGGIGERRTPAMSVLLSDSSP